jgi:hypothetical protein
MSWYGLLAILRQQKTEKETWEREPPVACPIDGAILQIHRDGRRRCPLGNYEWRGGKNPEPRQGND